MFEAFTKQWQQGLKPMTELAAVNAKAIEQLSQQQTKLFNTALQSNVEYAQELSQQQDVAGMVATQSDFLKKLQSDLSQAGTDTYQLALAAKDEAQQLLNSAKLETPAATTPKAKKAAPAKKAATSKAKKSAAKAEPKSIADEAQLKLK